MRLVLFAGAVCGAILQAQAPQFTWKGEVDGIVILHIHGKAVNVECRQGAPVKSQEFKFNSPLPDSTQKVRLEVREGRGSVQITEQPRIDNNYTASVTIEDRQDGASNYSIALYWNAERGSFFDEPDRRVGRMDRLLWKGHVQGEAIVVCGVSRCAPTPETDPSVTRESFKFTRPIPARETRVFLDSTDGPADFHLLQSPTAENGYTARIRIRAMPGGGDCSFTLSWPRAKRDGR